MLKLFIQSLFAWSPEFADVQAPGTSKFQIQSEDRYITSEITSSQGRRLSELTKTTVDLGLRIAKSDPVDHIVFSSRHGELSNAVQLLTMIGKHEVLSPMLFSQSVHNTAVGTYTLLKKTHAATTALSGGRNSFMQGLVSSAIYLQENPDHRVLYLAGDQPVPETFQQSLKEKNAACALALLLTNAALGDGLEIKMQSKPTPSANQKPLPQGIEFTKWFASPSAEVQLQSDALSWNLEKCFKS